MQFIVSRLFGLLALLPFALCNLDPSVLDPENQPAVPLAPINPIDQGKANSNRSNAKRQVDAQMFDGQSAIFQDQGTYV